MFKNYFKMAFRNLVKSKLYTAIIVFGLAAGLAACLMIIGHISHELSFEECHVNKDRIYRINSTYSSADAVRCWARAMSPLGPAMTSEIPEVEAAAVFRVLGNAKPVVDKISFKTEEDYVRNGYEHDGNVLCANSDFLKAFTIPLIQGNPETVLKEPFSVLVSEDAVGEYFFGEDPTGKIIKLNDELVCRVTGIMRNIPENTQVHCDFIVSYSSLEHIGEASQSWLQYEIDFVYVLLREGSSPDAVERKIPMILGRHMAPDLAGKYSFELQPLKDIYFSYYGSGRMGDLGPHGELSVFIEVGFIAVFILLLAIANFVNLSTARSADRMKEVGVRKVFGARRFNLIRQFLGESFFLTIVSIIIGLVFYELFKLWVQTLTSRQMFVDFYDSPLMIISVIALVIITGVIAGFYPALYISRFRPIAVLQSKMNIKSSKSILRKVLVVFQFTIAILFISITAVMYKQANLLTGHDLGFNKDNILVLEFSGDKSSENCMKLKNELLGNRNILSISAVNALPGMESGIHYGFYADSTRKENFQIAKVFNTDDEFMSLFDLEVVKGQPLSTMGDMNIEDAVLIDESTVEILGIDEPIGFRLYSRNKTYEVVGVVKDFNFAMMNFNADDLTIIKISPKDYKTLAIKIRPDKIPESIASVRNTWQAIFPDIPYEYKFLEDEIYKSNSDIRHQVKIFFTLAVLAITMACLGILGLVSFTARQKTKEIGIRKVLGATVYSIIRLLSKEYLVLIVIANIIAWPLSYMITNNFLQYYVVRAGMGIDVFLLVGGMAIIMALFAAGFQSVKAALADPVETLRYE
jgi:putative ABC transport system permease protein